MENKPDEVKGNHSLVTIDHLRAVALLMKWGEDYWPVIEGNETISYKIEFQKNLRLRLVYSQWQNHIIVFAYKKCLTEPLPDTSIKTSSALTHNLLNQILKEIDDELT